jgi:thiamine-phosphate pyrophosphorylase
VSGTGGAPPERCRLYLVTPPAFDPAAFKDTLAAALDAGDVASVQLRLKDAADDDICRACEILLPVAQQRGVAFILNDRPDLAAATGCDGVHIGQDDTPYDRARMSVGSERIIGVTCHASKHLAIEAAEAGADYVAFGAFFPSGTKAAKTQAPPELLRWWANIALVPCVAIGGITVDNCGPLVEAGADFLAVVSGVWDYPGGPGASVKAFNQAIARHSDR